MWFTISVLAAVAGGLLLAADYGKRTARTRERRRWAALRGWRFVESDPVLPDRWRHGVIPHGGGGQARDLVTGRLFTPDGRRTVHVFDYEQAGKVTGVLVAVARRAPLPTAVELWLTDVPGSRDTGLERVGPVGSRHAFADDLAAARPLITPELVAACEEIGEDVPVVWLEDTWVLAAAPTNASPARLERLLRNLGEIADLVDGVLGADASTLQADLGGGMMRARGEDPAASADTPSEADRGEH